MTYVHRSPRPPCAPKAGGIVLLLSGLLFFPSLAFAQKVISLSEAMRTGKVRFDAVAMHGFKKIDVTLINLTDRPLRIDPAGAVLLPPDPSLQRLGLGAPVDADPSDEETLLIRVPPNGAWSGAVWAVCLDHGKGVPATGVPYTLSAQSAEGKALEILRYWARNPWIQQKTVNDLIWTGQDLTVLRSQVIPAWLRKSSLRAWGGDLLWLSGTGRLFRRAGTEWKEIGKGFHEVTIAHGWIVGTNRSINGVRYRSLTGEGWRFKSLPGIPLEVLPAPEFILYARVENTLYRLAPGEEDFERATPLELAGASLLRLGRNSVLAVLEKDTGRVLRADSDDGTWNPLPGVPAKRIASSTEYLYAAFETGIFRFEKKWMKVASTGVEFLPAGSFCFLFKGETVLRYDESSGKTVELAPLKTTTLTRCVDPVEDKVYLLDERGGIMTWDGEKWLEVIKTPEKMG